MNINNSSVESFGQKSSKRPFARPHLTRQKKAFKPLARFNFSYVDNLAGNEMLLEKIYRLRYQVYVNEWGFESPADHPGGLEKDCYDSQSLHFYAYTENQNNIIGTVRIILPEHQLLPIQEVFEIDDSLINNPNYKVAEISRLAISKDFRRRAIDRVLFNNDNSYAQDLAQHRQSVEDTEKERRKCEHELIRGLYLLLYQQSVRLGLTHWYAVMARGLYVILARWGINFEQIGPEKDYHGVRAPYLISIAGLEKNLQKKNPDLLKLARQGIA